MESLRFMSEEQVRALQGEFETPFFVYDQRTLEEHARRVLAFPSAFGLTGRYAMKALPNAAVLRVLSEAGLHVDASSGFEAERAMRAGIAPQRIQITAQELPRDLRALVERGVLFNACSLSQLSAYGELFPGSELSVRINPGRGSGHSNRTNVGGPSASFGIWHEHLDELLETAARHRLRVARMHTHIGSGSDPDKWVVCAKLSLAIAARLPDVTTLSLGGGFKVARMAREDATDLVAIGQKIVPEFEAFARNEGRKLHLEVEPGTYLVANAGALVCTVRDLVSTGAGGHRFIKLDSGMTEVLRPSMYGAQHPLVVVPRDAARESQRGEFLVAGHCCESGDILTPEAGNPEGLGPRELLEPRLGDALVIEGAGAYCASMASKNYNSFPECAEVLLTRSGEHRLIRRRQTLDQLLENEVLPD
ncbi:MAG: diaminopimelate decarboxylase [Deltaproteobacteria bacterium]|nr:diaminopimelate decarboxylase [Deltaproteobacteria bacterium]MBW2417600.1 diaminopimelate decarboxylase [Deltaproteobacteria bacterium]